MKITNGVSIVLLTLCGFGGESDAFMPISRISRVTMTVQQSASSPPSSSDMTSSSSPNMDPNMEQQQQQQSKLAIPSSVTPPPRPASEPTMMDLSQLAFPPNMALARIEGGKTVRTYQIPLDVERAQVYIKTNGRPMKAKVELWVGPLRTVHTMDMDVEDGNESVYRALLKFKKAGPTLRIITSEEEALPVLAGVQVLKGEQNALVAKYTENLWDISPKTKIQGGPTSGGPGAVRVFPIDASVDTIQLICWSKDTSKKSLKAKIELLQGPNNYKQVYDLQCGGGSQPFHLVLQTPGAGWVVRIYNKKFVEDGLFEVAVVPFVTGTISDSLAPESVIRYPNEGVRRGGPPINANANNPYRQKPWWE
jgi:hypothetical protein